MMMLTDDEIKREIVNQIDYDSRMDSSKIQVFVKEGCVTLSGSTPTILARQAAYDIALIVPGVHSVDDLINVMYPPDVARPKDIEFRSNIERILDWNPELDAADINVHVQAGSVTLAGSVDAYWKKLLAEELCSNIRGVVEINNKLSVTPTGSIIDEDLAKDIVEALDRNVAVNPGSVDLKVENGTVTLSGIVESWSAKRAAFFTVVYTKGVSQVVDKMMVR